MYSYKHKEQVPIIVRFLGPDKNLRRIFANYSKASLDNLKSILNNKLIYIPDNHFILCPVYMDRITGKYDFQIGISGSIKYKTYGTETYFEAMCREVGEEVGLVVTPDLYSSSILNKKNFVFKIENLKDVPKTYSKLSINSNLDITPKQKVCSVIHGSEINIDMYLSQNNIYTYKNTDDIVAIGKMKVSEVRRYLYYK